MKFKLKYMVVCHFEEFIKLDNGSTTNRLLLHTSNEGVFDNKNDAIERLEQMTEEESQNNSEMHFEIKEVFSK